jgi:citrate lyase subunit beta / citryl-CoA lyase
MRKSGGKSLRRSKLAVPGNNRAALEEAARSGADIIQIDLEDSIAPSEKAAAREIVLAALEQIEWGDAERWIKIDAFAAGHAEEDVFGTARGRPDAYALGKVEGPEDMILLGELIERAERRYAFGEQSIRMVAVIERIRALNRVEEIAACNSRMTSLGLGPYDLGAELGYRLDFTGYSLETLYAKSRCILAARLAGIDISDMGYMFSDDGEGTIRSTLFSLQLGFTTKGSHSAKQIPLIHSAFSLNELGAIGPDAWL